MKGLGVGLGVANTGGEDRVDAAEGVGGAKSGVAVGRDDAEEVGVGGARYCVPVGGEEVEGEEDSVAVEVGGTINSVAVGGAEGDAEVDSESKAVALAETEGGGEACSFRAARGCFRGNPRAEAPGAAGGEPYACSCLKPFTRHTAEGVVLPPTKSSWQAL